MLDAEPKRYNSTQRTPLPQLLKRKLWRTMAEDYYKTLGVNRNASQAEIQKAYRDLARKHHPDRNPDDPAAKKKFQAIQAAFDVLNDPKKRELYDRYGSAFEHMGSGGPRGGPGWGAGPGQGPGGEFNFEDIDFGQFFGDRFGGQSGIDLGSLFGQFATGGRAKKRSARGRARGSDLVHELEVPFTLSITGGVVEIGLPGRQGTIEVKIPPGIEDGKKIRLRGQGEPVPGGTPGDLLINIRVAPHPHFTRRGNHLHVRVPVTLAEATLGAKIDVPTPNGTVSVRIPPGTSSGTKLRVKGQGVAAKGTAPGDLMAEVMIVLPKNIDDRAGDLIRQLDSHWKQTGLQDPRADLRW